MLIDTTEKLYDIVEPYPNSWILKKSWITDLSWVKRFIESKTTSQLVNVTSEKSQIIINAKAAQI